MSTNPKKGEALKKEKERERPSVRRRRAEQKRKEKNRGIQKRAFEKEEEGQSNKKGVREQSTEKLEEKEYSSNDKTSIFYYTNSGDSKVIQQWRLN